jgi:hypothetical protein
MHSERLGLDAQHARHFLSRIAAEIHKESGFGGIERARDAMPADGLARRRSRRARAHQESERERG